MDHDRAERLIGERLDGERLVRRDEMELERHLVRCAECRAFELGAWRLRERVRFEVAPAVPDLVDPIMQVVRTAAGRPGLRVVMPGEPRGPRGRSVLPRLAPAIAAVLVGVLVGSVLVGGPWAERDGRVGRSALAAEDVTRGVAAAATGLDAYSARFTITERNLSPEVPERELSMRVWFEAPERFRLDVVDRTTDPRTATPTDVRLIVDEDEWYVAAPAPCPAATCPMEATAVRNRVPFSSSAPAPTDLVLPLTALADADDVEVLGAATILGREAIRVQVPFERAASLFPFLSLGGDWRPFFERDRVRIWLDAESWFPLRWEVLPVSGARRAAWAERFGLPTEPPNEPVFTVEALAARFTSPPAGVFDVPQTAIVRDHLAREVALAEVEELTGFEPLSPAETGMLEPHRAVVLAEAGAGARESVVTYADGLAFLKIAETRSWSADAPFGPIDVHAEEVPLGSGVAYFEPAAPPRGRVLAIHAAGTDVYVESNLPRNEILEIAAGLPVTGLPMPTEWTIRRTDAAVAERVTLAQARRAVGFAVDVPPGLPQGFALASVEVVRTRGVTGVTLFLRDIDIDVGAGTIRLHLEPATSLPPAIATRPVGVDVAGAEGRWTPEGSTLEWVDDGVYRSLTGPGFDLDELLRIATGGT
ncbi:MAG TPA: zf-HC2 domain-containing protein [Actinomycetota bacterium]|nr:zf-HC2 domain-containing protein [Actinomycetota bacterium]